MPTNNLQYSPVSGVDEDNDEAKLLYNDEILATHKSRHLVRLWPWFTHGALLIVNVLFLTLWIRAPTGRSLTIYSPANEAIEYGEIIRFNGSLGAPSIYRGEPSPELEAVWDKISIDSRPNRMTLDELLRTGDEATPSKAKYPEEFGGGYMATVEVIHQLHCVNMLRKITWGDHYKHDHSFHDTPEGFRTHLDHCIEMMRQNIMCRSDVTMITYDWVKGSKDPFPNFNIPHKCRDFDKILDWVDEHRVFVPKSKVVRQDDTVDLPSPP